MSLRDILKMTISGKVARCTPYATQHATSTPECATARATTVQPLHATPREYSVSSATTNATGAQPASCVALENDPRKVARVARGSLTAHRQAADLAAAINCTCDLRGDDDANRAALIAECLALSLDGQADMVEHFTEQARMWQAACKGIAP